MPGSAAQIRLPAPLVAGTGLTLVVGVILYGALAHAPFRMGYVALAILGCAMQVAAPFLDKRPVAVAARRPATSGLPLPLRT